MVHYRDSAAGGGSLRVGETIANHVDPKRIAAEMVFAYGSAGPVTKSARVPCHFIGARGPGDFAAWPRARALFKRLQPDIIHFQDGVVWLRAALTRTSARKLVHVHARYASRNKKSPAGAKQNHPYLATQLFRTFLRSTDAQVCINHGARNALLDLDWIAPERSFVVYNSIDVGRFDDLPEPARARAGLNLPPDALLLGMICRLVWEKGCFDFLSVIERLPQRWQGVICGDGPQRAELQRACEGRGLADRIHFIGVRDDVRQVYAALDAYAFLSHYEPFGLVLAEAMAAGKPIFGIRSEGEFTEAAYPLVRDDIAELQPFARDGDYGLIVPPLVLDQLAKRISDFGDHLESFGDMIARARTWVEHCFDKDVQAEAMTRVYENLIARRLSPQARLDELYQTRREHAELLLSSANQEESVAAIA
jgi:glycosyltransferase involved in cell wall biosynthesis